MSLDIVPYGGWEECVRLTDGIIELIVTTQVGPRIMRYGFVGGPNEFLEYEDQIGKRREAQYRSYGGHRLWVAPETKGWTNHPDNEPVTVDERGGETIFTAQVQKGTGLQKSIALSFPGPNEGISVRHTVKNRSEKPVTCAPWALSVMAPGGTAILPQERFISHTEKVLPARPTVLWHYTDMTDPRWTWGKQFIRLRQSTEAVTPQKAGVLSSAGWAAHHRNDRLFLKRFPFSQGATYPDFGCNVEIFTNAKMLEVESLGPLRELHPGESAEHIETWHLFRDIALPADDGELEEVLSRRVFR